MAKHELKRQRERGPHRVDESAQHVVTFFYTYKYHKKQRGQLGGQTKSNETEPDFLLLPFLSSHARTASPAVVCLGGVKAEGKQRTDIRGGKATGVRRDEMWWEQLNSQLPQAVSTGREILSLSLSHKRNLR